MAKKSKTQVQKQGNLLVLLIWLFLFFPIGIVYWLFRYKRIKTYEYKK